MDLLEVQALSFAVRDRKILDRLDLALAEGEIHALLGANGTGKTTLACIVMGCAGYVPDTGEIRFRGRRLNDLPLHERARLGITLAWQEPARFEGLRVRDYLSLGGTRADPAACLARVGLEPELYLERAVDKTLSGGQRKRVELASILALKPVLAILDEPAAGIDMLSIGEIAEVIHGFKRDGTTVLLITHQQEIARVADRASYLCGGRIVLTGSPQAVAERYQARRCVVCDGQVCRNETTG
jgi:Fe-S cluster assembly ATP-binding protein